MIFLVRIRFRVLGFQLVHGTRYNPFRGVK